MRHYAAYLSSDGHYHEEGGFKTEKEAAKKAAQLELDASRGDWASPIAGQHHLRRLRRHLLPAHHPTPGSLHPHRLRLLPRQALPTPVRHGSGAPDQPSHDPSLGQRRHDRRPAPGRS